MKLSKKLFTVAIAAVISVVGSVANAGQQSQVDTTDALGTLSTNLYALYGDSSGSFTNGIALTTPNSFIDGTKTTQLPMEVGGWFVNTATGPSNVVFRVYQSQDAHLWSSYSNITVSVPALSTNYAWTQFFVGSSQGGPMSEYALREIDNTNAANVTAPTNQLFLKGFSKSAL